MHENSGVWDQNYLAKALMTLKETEFQKLKFPDGCYKPYEYEKWIKAVTMSLTAVHPELGGYWNRVVKSAEAVYNAYLNDVSTTRVSLKPKDTLQRTEIEERMENKIRTLLMTAVPHSQSTMQLRT